MSAGLTRSLVGLVAAWCAWWGGAALLGTLTSCEAPDDTGLFERRPGLTPSGAGGSGAEDKAVDAGNEPRQDAGPSSEGQGGSSGLENDGGSTALPYGNTDAGLLDAGAGGTVVDASPAPPVCTPATEVCDGLDNDCDGVVDEGSACEEDCAGFALEARGYMFCAESVDRAQAVALCELQGLRLAWIETSEENAFLIESIAVADVPAPDEEEILTHIGGSDSGNDSGGEGSWSWRGTEEIADGFQYWQGTSADDGGQPVGGAFANWSPSEPNDTDGDEDCAVLSVLGNNNRVPGNWDDRDCDTELPFVCEVP